MKSGIAAPEQASALSSATLMDEEFG